MNKFTHLLFGVLSLLCLQVSAQRNYDIRLQSGTIDAREEKAITEITADLLRASTFEDHHYLILQFEDIPDAGRRQILREKGIRLLAYLPHYAYWASVPTGTDFTQLPVRNVIPQHPHHKLSSGLAGHVLPPVGEDGQMPLIVYPFPDIPTAVLGETLAQSGFQVDQVNDQRLLIRIRPKEMLKAASIPGLMYLEALTPTPQPEDLSARSLHGFHALSAGLELDLDGAGSVITVADDGIVEHPDFKNRITHHLDANDPDHHGDMVLGILSGAGNIDPLAAGMAPGAEIHLFDITDYDHINQAPENYERYGATITCTSYGEGCGGFYGGTARDIDAQVHAYPFLLHCFSAGNGAAEDCGGPYGEIRDREGYSFGNITGGQKAAKNVITVGNLHFNDQRMRLSSRGPAADGRIKPDLCAYGQGQISTYPEDSYRPAGGSSAAAPVVAGAAAVLTQLYRQLHPEEEVPGDLLKAAMLNTAEDLGLPGPDFKHGWGRLQVQRAAELLRQEQYLQAVASHGAENTHQIVIPEGALDLRIMLYWHDPAPSLSAGIALVNDLDMIVEPPAGAAPIHPWVLSAAPQLDSINGPAYRGVDRLNNVEQVSIDRPGSGAYDIRVKGHLVPEGPQSYYIVYSYRTKDLELTFPTGGEHFTPGEKQTIRWETFGLEAPFQLEYRLEGGPWTLIATNISPQAKYFNWYIPTNVYGRAEIRLSAGARQDISVRPFSILAQPEFRFRYESDSTAWIRWDPVPGAEIYDVYILGDLYMEEIGSSNTNRFRLRTTPGQMDWYSVRARRLDGATGRRAIAKRYLHLPCETTVNLQIQFDAYPGEISWQLRDSADRIFAGGGPYDEREPASLLDISECLPFGCYELVILDSYGDGLCCQGGTGSYQLLDANGKVLAAGDSFNFEDRTSFCLEPGDFPPSPEPLTLELLNMEHVSCHGGSDGQISVQVAGGDGVYFYQWSDGQNSPTAANLSAGDYTLTVSDDNETIVQSFRIGEPAPLTLVFDITKGSCEEGGDGQVTALPSGGVAPYSYYWSNGGRTAGISGLSPGPYTLTVTDANGCTVTDSVTLENNADMQLSLKVHQPRCPGDANGRVITTLTGGQAPFDYTWNTGDTTISITQLPPGTYELTVTDAAGCRAVASATLLPPTPIQIEADITPVTNAAPGQILLRVSGGMPDYQYLWADGPTTPERNGLTAGDYFVTVTDYKGCTQPAAFTVPDETTDEGISYCPATGRNTSQEWIEAIAINSTWFVSGNNQGYQSYIDRPVAASAGRALMLSLRLGLQSGSPLHYWRVWIDFDQNGRLDDEGELVFQSATPREAYDVEIPIPAGLQGQTRMRVAMQWAAVPPDPCSDLPWGEVEDYTLAFAETEAAPESLGRMAPPPSSGFFSPTPPRIRVYPNPTRHFFHLEFQQLPEEAGQLRLLNAQGQPVAVWPWKEKEVQGVRRLQLAPSLPPGLYYLQLQVGGQSLEQRLLVY